MPKLVRNFSSFLSGIRKEPKKLERKVLLLVSGIIRFTHQGVTKRTPVHTGQTLRNYIWSLGVPSSTVKPDPGGPPTGRTNDMPLGPEPRRRQAQAEADQSRDAILGVLKDPYQKVFLSNNSPQVVGLEYGRYPLPPLRQRSPSGMFRVTLAEVAARLRAGAL